MASYKSAFLGSSFNLLKLYLKFFRVSLAGKGPLKLFVEFFFLLLEDFRELNVVFAVEFGHVRIERKVIKIFVGLLSK